MYDHGAELYWLLRNEDSRRYLVEGSLLPELLVRDVELEQIAAIYPWYREAEEDAWVAQEPLLHGVDAEKLVDKMPEPLVREMFWDLLRAGADVNNLLDSMWDKARWCVKQDLKKLLAAGADPKRLTACLWLAVGEDIGKSPEEVLELLVKYGLDLQELIGELLPNSSLYGSREEFHYNKVVRRMGNLIEAYSAFEKQGVNLDWAAMAKAKEIPEEIMLRYDGFLQEHGVKVNAQKCARIVAKRERDRKMWNGFYYEVERVTARDVLEKYRKLKAQGELDWFLGY